MRVLELGQGPPDFGMEGPAWDSHSQARLPGRGDRGVTLQLPTPWPPGTHPRAGGGGRGAGGRPGARQPPGPPAPVAVVTARANWPVEPAGGSCSDLEGQGHHSPGRWVQRGGDIQRPEHTGEGGGDGYFSMLRSVKCRSPPPCLPQSAPKTPRIERNIKYPCAPPSGPTSLEGMGRDGLCCLAKKPVSLQKVMTGHAKVTRSDAHLHLTPRPSRAAGF